MGKLYFLMFPASEDSNLISSFNILLQIPLKPVLGIRILVELIMELLKFLDKCIIISLGLDDKQVVLFLYMILLAKGAYLSVSF